MDFKEKLNQYLQRKEQIIKTKLEHWLMYVVIFLSGSIFSHEIQTFIKGDLTDGLTIHIIALVFSFSVLVASITYFIVGFFKTEKKLKQLNNEFGVDDLKCKK